MFSPDFSAYDTSYGDKSDWDSLWDHYEDSGHLTSTIIEDYDGDWSNYSEKGEENDDFHAFESRVNNYRGKGSKSAKGKPKGKSKKCGSGDRSRKGQKGFEKCKVCDFAKGGNVVSDVRNVLQSR